MMSKKNKTPAKVKQTEKSIPFQQVDIEASSDLGIDFDEDGFPKGTRDKRKLDNRKNK